MNELSTPNPKAAAEGARAAATEARGRVRALEADTDFAELFERYVLLLLVDL
jgi:hypothetical protein